MVELQSLKNYLNIKTTDQDSVLGDIIEYATEWINSICNRTLLKSEITFGIDGNGKDRIILNDYPVSEIKSVKYREDPSIAWENIPTTSFLTLNTNQVDYLYYENTFVKNANYEITIEAGYETVPKDLQLICIEICTVIYQESKLLGGVRGGRLGIESITESINGISTNTKFKDLQRNWERRLGKYRRPTV